MRPPPLNDPLAEPSVCSAGEGGACALRLTVEDEIRPEHLLPNGLHVVGRRRRERRSIQPGDLAATPLAAGARPVLQFGTRTWVDADGAARLALPAGAPHSQRRNGVITHFRRFRQVVVGGDLRTLWRVLRLADGTTTIAQILDACTASERADAVLLLRALRDLEALDLSGRAIARFVHATTKRGGAVLPPLTQAELRRLALDASYRRYPGAAELPLDRTIPEALAPLHAITRDRRSAFGFGGGSIARRQLDAILTTACGVSAIGDFGNGETFAYRAYPSPGGLYAVEAYPVVFNVAGLAPGIYHLRAADGVLEALQPGVDPGVVLEPALPLQRPLVEGVALLIVLTGVFPRLEQKYGEGCYRVLAAEAGHMSEALLLAATALGLATRPLGGFVDDLLNAALGLDIEREQFLLAVAIGQPC